MSLRSVDFDQKNGKPVKAKLASLLNSGNMRLFADPYSGHLSQLSNDGLKLANLRFYGVES